MARRFVDAPWLTISADVMEFTASRHGFKYLLVMQDLFTKWVELCPMRKNNGKTIARAIEDLVLFRWDTPEFVLTDNGKEFDNKTINDMIKEYGMRHINVLPYHAQANPTERVNRTLKPIIAMFVDSNHKTWDERLPEFRFALNTAIAKATKVSPAFLNFGRHPKLAKSLRRKLEDVENPEVVVLDTKLWNDRLKRLHELQDLVIRHVEESQNIQKLEYDKRHKDVTFGEGDEVMRRTQVLSSAEKSFCAKLAPKYEEPARITKVLSDVAYEIETNSGRRIPKVHVSDLRPFHKPQRPINKPISTPVATSAPEKPVENSAPRKRGRPSKTPVTINPTESREPRKRGRPRKSQKVVEPNLADVETLAPRTLRPRK